MNLLPFSAKALRTGEQPISYLVQQAVENPGVISLAAGLVDGESLPAAEVAATLAELFADPAAARAALQYGTTAGHAPLRQLLLEHVARLDRVAPAELGVTADDVVVTTGSQQLLYMLGEVLLDPGDLVITEAPSYLVNHGILTSQGATVLAVPTDAEGLVTDALAGLLTRLESAGELGRVKMIYVCDYFQNPTGRTLSPPRRRHLVEL